MKHSLYLHLLFCLFFSIANAQPPGGKTATETEYEQDKIESRSKKSHKKADKITDKNNKIEDKANKKAEKDRKEKLGDKKKKEDQHKFNF